MADGTARSSGGGLSRYVVKTLWWCLFEMHRCQDAKRHGLLRFELFRKIDKFLSLNFRNILISPLEGEKKFLSELCELRNFREGFNLKRSCRNSNSDLPKQLWCIPLNKFLILGRKISLFIDTVFSRFTSHFSLKRKAAFTLAEVLITLGIIGIVASMTLPSLIQSYKERVTVTKVQKAYSILNQAFKRISEEYGEPQNWPDVQNGAPNCNSCALAHKNLYSKYIIGKNHNGARGNTNDPIKTLNGGIFTWNRYNPSITTSDGIVYQFSHFRNCGGYWLTTGNLSACEMGGDVSIDINGYDKGPNQLGKDVFAFVTAQNGVYPAGLPGSYTAGDCKLSGRGFSCTEYILREKNMKYLKEN